jgi:hypothetical protein
MTLYVPPLAHLPRALESLEEMISLLGRALMPAQRFRRVRDSQENDLQLAIVVHSLNSLDAARGAYALGTKRLFGPLSVEFRVIFEVLVKIRWMRRHPPRATNYLVSEPFERYALANDRVRRSDKWPGIVQDCKNSVAQHPSLLNLPGATKGAARRPAFKAIVKALRMPPLEEMAAAVGEDEDVYLIDVDVPSLYPHTSVTYTRNFHKRNNSDGTAFLSTQADPIMLLGSITRATTRLGEILKEALDNFPDGAIQFDAEAAAERLADVVRAVRGYLLQT